MGCACSPLNYRVGRNKTFRMVLSLYNGKEQKEHIDEGIERLYARNEWQQSYSFEFIRLGFGFMGVIVALYVYYLERTVPFRDSKTVVGFLCVLYFCFTWGGWLWQRTVERNAMYVGTKNGSTVYIKTETPKNSDKYVATVILKNADSKESKYKHTYLISEIVDSLGIVHEEKLLNLVKCVNSK